MKKLIKFMSLLLCMMLALSFAACSNNKDDDDDDGDSTNTPSAPQYNQVQTLNDKTTAEVYSEVIAQVDSYQENFTGIMNYDIAVIMNMQGQTFNMDMKLYDTLMVAGEEFYEDILIDMGSMAIMGQTMDMGEVIEKAWLVDDYAYLYTQSNVMGDIETTKYKYGATFEALLEVLEKDVADFYNPIYDFTDVAFEDVKFCVNKQNSNDVFFEMVLTGEEASDFANQNLSDLNINGNMTIGDISYKFILDGQGNFSHVEIEYDVDMTALLDSQGTTATYDYHFVGEIRFSDIGTTVVTAPADADTYTYLGSLT